MAPQAIYSAEPARGWIPWGPLTPVLGIAMVAASVLGASLPLEHWRLVDDHDNPDGLIGLIAFLPATFTTLGLVVLGWVRLVERRPLATIGLVRKGSATGFARGLLTGVVMIAVLVLAIWGMGGFRAGAAGQHGR